MFSLLPLSQHFDCVLSGIRLDKELKNKKMATKVVSMARMHPSQGSSQNMGNLPVYPNTMDLVGMDYSEAQRMPPIHN